MHSLRKRSALRRGLSEVGKATSARSDLEEQALEQAEHVPRSVSSQMSQRIRFVLWALTMHEVPFIIGQIALRILLTTQPIKELGFVELFAGRRAVTRGMWDDGRLAIPYDIQDDHLHEDILMPEGFAYAMMLLLALEGGGGVWAGIVCSSWIGLNRYTSGRRPWKPLGHIQYVSVRDGNMMAARLAALLIVAEALGLWYVVEQPAGSLLFCHPRMQRIIATTIVSKYKFRQCDFGAVSPKPTWLWSNRSFVRLLDDEKLESGAAPTTTLVQRGKQRDGRGSGAQNRYHHWICGGIPSLSPSPQLLDFGSPFV